MTSGAWIGVVSQRHVALAVAGGFAMFSHGRHAAAARVQAGDWVAYYSPREGIDDGAAIRAFTAIGEVLPGEPEAREMAASETGWARRMRWLDARPADIYPLLEKFAFVGDRRHWGMHFRKSLFRIDWNDFLLVADAMGVGREVRNR